MSYTAQRFALWHTLSTPKAETCGECCSMEKEPFLDVNYIVAVPISFGHEVFLIGAYQWNAR
jgi:hypothetical protein